MEGNILFFIQHFLTYLGIGLGIYIPLALFTLLVKRFILDWQATIENKKEITGGIKWKNN